MTVVFVIVAAALGVAVGVAATRRWLDPPRPAHRLVSAPGRLSPSPPPAPDPPPSPDPAAESVALDKARALNDNFISMLAHDLRAPVRTMRSFADVLAELAAGHDDDQMLDYAKRICRGADQLHAMIAELRAFSSATNGNGHEQRWRVSEIVSTALDRLEQQIESKQADVRVTIEDCDEERMPASFARVLQNLLDNALKYTESRPIVRVSVRREAGDIGVVVEDDGLGFDPGDADTMFRMFKQLHPHSALSQGGMGVGLAFCRKIVEHHGGSIQAVSEGLGKGATFHVRLPMSH